MISSVGRQPMIMGMGLYLWYLWGFSFPFMVSYILLGIIPLRFVDLTTIALITFSALSWFLTNKKVTQSRQVSPLSIMKLRRGDSIFVLFVCLFAFSMLWALSGVINLRLHGYTPSLGSYVGPLRRSLILLFMLVAYLHFGRRKWLLVERALLRGFIHASVLTAVWMWIEQILYVVYKIPLNELVFRRWLGLNPGVGFINLISPGYTGLGYNLYRASGFSWDPGTTTTMIVIAWFLYTLMPKGLIGRKRLFISMILLSALPLGLSRTSIISVAIGLFSLFGIYLVLSFIQASVTGYTWPRIWRNGTIKFVTHSILYSIFVFIISVVIMGYMIDINPYKISMGIYSFVKAGLEGKTVGEQRHWAYFRLIPSALALDWPSMLFGYGTANVGVAMERVGSGVLPKIEEIAATFHGDWNPESTFVTMTLMGGLISAALLWFCVFATMARAGFGCLRGLSSFNGQIMLYVFVILCTLIVMSVGYGIDATWLYVVFFLLLRNVWAGWPSNWEMQPTISCHSRGGG